MLYTIFKTILFPPVPFGIPFFSLKVCLKSSTSLVLKWVSSVCFLSKQLKPFILNIYLNIFSNFLSLKKWDSCGKAEGWVVLQIYVIPLNLEFNWRKQYIYLNKEDTTGHLIKWWNQLFQTLTAGLLIRCTI